MQQEPAFAKLVILYLLSRIVRIEEDFVDHILHSREKRLARVLLLLARSGRQSKSKSGMVSQQTLAEMVGTTRSRVSFFMNGFRKRGIHPLQGSLRVHRGLFTPSHCGSKRNVGPAEPTAELVRSRPAINFLVIVSCPCRPTGVSIIAQTL